MQTREKVRDMRRPSNSATTPPPRWPAILVAAVVIAAYVAFTAYVAHSNLHIQSLVLVAAVFGVLAISLDMAVGMLGLYSLGQGGFFAIGAYLTTVLYQNYQILLSKI